MKGDDEAAAFERRMRRRRAIAEIVAGVALLALFAWRMSRVRCDTHDEPAPPAVDLDVDASGHATVRGCTDELRTCLVAAYHHGGPHVAAIHVAAGAPADAVRDVRAVLVQIGFLPVHR